MNKILFSLVVLVMTFFAASSAMAEIRGGEITLSPFFGMNIFDGSQQETPGFATGLRLGYNLGKFWGVESQLTYILSKDTNDIGKGVDQYSIRGDLLRHFMPDNEIVPFIAFGGGWSRSENFSGIGRGPTFDLGVGLKYFASHAVALRADFRQIFSFPGNSNNNTSNYWLNAEFTFGMSFQFGGARPAVPAVKEIKPAPGPAMEGPTRWLAEKTEAPPGKIMITGLEIDGNVLKITATADIRGYKVFTLTQPSRLVIDIPDAVHGFSVDTIPIERSGIATVRFESNPDFLRIFLDAAQGRLLPYRIEKTDHGLNIILTPL